MKWLQDNPVGMILASMSGFFLLLALGMAIVWNLPVSVDTEGADAEVAAGSQQGVAFREIGELGDYQVINAKPVFNESRQPDISGADDELGEDDTAIEIKDAPDVKLTGVVITPSSRIASLTPANQNIKSVMVQEGESLTGEFVGWRVAAVQPRTVVLESRDGQSLELELQVHDTKIAEPPPVVAPAAISQALSGVSAEQTDVDEEPMSRAEQIRQRIAERREELRLEQEANQSGSGTQVGTANQPAKSSDYQSAIRAMMKNKSKDQSSNDEKDG